MRRPQLISKGSLNRMLQTADESLKKRDFQQCIETLERASKLDHANCHILVQLGRIYGMRYEHDKVEHYFEKAVRIAPNKSEILATIGKYCYDLRNYQWAERYYRRAMQEKNVSPEIFVRLAELCERLHRVEEANQLVDQALRINNAWGSALMFRARLERQAGKVEAAEKYLRSFLLHAEPTARMQGWYELGALLDRLGRYDEAMNAFLEAKAIIRPIAGQQLKELQIVRSRINGVKNNISADILQQWFDSRDELQPFHRLALLCGHPRSGTTLLEQVLDSHPDIVSSEETEIFYDQAYSPLLRRHPDDVAMHASLIAATPDLLQQCRKSYFRTTESALGDSIGNRLLIDKNPSYTFLIPAFVRVFPESKILVALRDPRDVILSCFMQNIPLNQVAAAYLSLESTVEEYGALMDVWQTIKPIIHNPYLEVRYEDMVEDLEAIARKTLDFLGVPWSARVLGFDQHARQKVVRSPTYADVTQPVYKRAVGRWRNYHKYLEPHLPKLEPFIKTFGYE